MFIRLIAAVMAACLIGISQPASAQEPTTAPPEAAAEAGARELELADRFIQLTVLGDLSKTVEIIMEQVIAQGEHSEEDEAFLREQLPRMMEDAMDRTLDNLTPLYARTFSEAQLEALVGFYESPLGVSITERSISIAMEQEAILQAEMQRFLVEFLAKYCSEFGCAGGPDVSQMGK